MIPDDSTTTAITAKLMPQHGGKYADHEFVKVASKVIKGVERAPYNQFETILVNYDKMKEIKGKRNLTKSEQRIYDKADKLIQKEFDAMFKKADTMLDQLDRKTTVQKGGGLADMFKRKNKVMPAAPDAAATPAAAEEAPAPPSATSDAHASSATDATPVKGPPATNAASTPAAAAATSDATAAKEGPATNAAPTAATPAAAAAAGPKDAKNPKENETSFMDSNRFYRWIVSLLKGIWEWIKGLFTGAFSDKFEQLRKQFSADELFKLFGNDHNKMDAATEALRVQAEKIQRLVATGIGGAASASIDMILNAFSMSPVFGTTILVWRMFQNMLMIMGASLSVQAASNSGATTLATIADPKLAGEEKIGGGKAKAKNNVTKRLKTDIRQLNRSLKRYMHFPQRKSTTMSGAGSGYSYT